MTQNKQGQTTNRHYYRRAQCLTAAAFCTFLFSSPAISATNLISNGSFELPVLVPGSDYLVAPVGSAVIPSWSVVGPAGKNVAIIEALYNLPDAAGINFAAADGVQWIDMAGAGANTFEGVEQIVHLVSGSYDLSFSVGNVIAPANALGSQSTIDLWINGTKLQSYTNSASGGTGINWQGFSHTFVGIGSTTIQFRNADGTNDNLNGLDNVFLSAVPEASITTMLILGIAILGLGTRVRARRIHGRLKPL